jgi:hypothetical protein
MKIYEILLPKTLKDKSLTGKVYKDIDTLQTRMNLYVDKISNMATGKARDFLKTKLQADYTALKDIIQKSSIVSEAVHKLPLTPEDFNLVKQLMKHPIPAIVAPMYVMEVIDDDELNDQFRSLEENEPNRDVRPLIVEWIKRVMPDQMYHFGQEVADENQRKGILSPLHGDDPHMYKGGSWTGSGASGDAYGKF